MFYVSVNVILNHNLIINPKPIKAFDKGKSGNFTFAISPQTQPQIPQKIAANPAYFHPSFCGVGQIKELSKFLDYAIANPHDAEFIRKNLSLSFFNEIDTLIETTKPLGSGQSNKVFRLDEKYVLSPKIGQNADYKSGFKLANNQKFQELKTWYGGSLAEIFGIKVLKNANPTGDAIQVGIPYKQDISAENIRIYNEVYLPQCANLPQKAFDDIAQDFHALNTDKDLRQPLLGFRYVFDCVNPNNFLIDKNSIKIVDELAQATDDEFNTLANMFQSLIVSYQPHTWTSFNAKLIEPRREIIKKCLIGCEKVGLELEEKDNGLDRVIIKTAFNHINLNCPVSSLEKLIIENRKNIPDPKERAELLGKYFDKL